MPKKTAEREAILPVIAEVFREHGYEGASLSLIGARTGLGKGSLYHFFPGGKEEMAEAVLAGIDAWFETRIFTRLREDPDPGGAIRAMLRETDGYFRSGGRVCLVGVLALGETRDRFGAPIAAYFTGWRDALACALCRSGVEDDRARERAEDAVAAIQGGLVAARAFQDAGLFARMLETLEGRLLVEGPTAPVT